MGDCTVQPHPLGDGSVFGVVACAVIKIVVAHYGKVRHQKEKPQECDEVWSKPHGQELEEGGGGGEREGVNDKGREKRRRDEEG